MFWSYELGEGRVFGCVPGHSAHTFDDPLFRKLLLRGIAWAAGENPSLLDEVFSKINNDVQSRALENKP